MPTDIPSLNRGGMQGCFKAVLSIKICNLISKNEPYKVMIEPEKVLLLVGWWEDTLPPFFTKQERYLIVTEKVVLTFRPCNYKDGV